MQATPCGVEEKEDPEFWQCACEQQICSRPRADWQLSGGVLQCGRPGSCHRRPRSTWTSAQLDALSRREYPSEGQHMRLQRTRDVRIHTTPFMVLFSQPVPSGGGPHAVCAGCSAE